MKIIEDPPLAGDVERKLPWVIDIFLYPLSISGLIHIVIFSVIPFVISLIHIFILDWIWPVGELIFVLLYLLYVGYVFFYLGYCIFDSSKGGLRAPEVLAQHTPDKGDCISQMGLLLGCFAICFWPVSVYFVLTMNTDWLFWLLLMSGVFFLPMGLLRGVMFDCLDALNPVLIIRSISRVFFSYCGLVLFFSVITALMVFVLGDLSALLQVHSLRGWLVYVFYLLARFSRPDFIFRSVVIFYLAMIASYLLGRFYLRHKQQLGWGI